MTGYNMKLDYPFSLIAAVLELDLKDNRDIELLDRIKAVDDIEGSVAYVLHTLSERDQKIIYNRFVEKLSLASTAKLHNVSTERIRQIESRALSRLRKKEEYLTYGIAEANKRIIEQAERKLADRIIYKNL